ncbi:helix-turn-helix domain-containing protein [Neorhodopirellula pilleata]|uniref:Anaerobic benzoate catabolism transcriptional regulator n=1 Tax=Neorhodopirellula pilleata TaxID=2714738 RepID=A0A5C6AGU1_9BACT|nr:helix-turn-helix transcriptional regulator [Neorhodopirellula pilleata]TWT98829.1 anaerobic benzoate catabolism transcriptional regulator [Neorhodopirellula pilleata]
MPRGSDQIREARQARGLTQLQLAVRAGVSVRTLQFAEGGQVSVSANKLEQIANWLDLSYEQACCVEDRVEDDELARLPWSLSRFIQTRAAPPAEAFLHDEEAVLAVVRRMRDNWKWHLDRDADDPATELFERGDRLLDESLSLYEQRYLAIWKKNPACFQLARCGGVCSGLTVVLPVTQTAYQRFRNGEISFMEISAHDIQQESQFIVLDSATDFPGSGKVPWRRMTDSLAYALFHRIAMLSRDPSADDFRMLSFGASRLNLQRLISLGFEDCQTSMPEFDFPICEFSLNGRQELDDNYANASTTIHFARLLRPFKPSVAKSAMTKRIIRAGLKTLQKLVKPPARIDVADHRYVA